MTVMIMVKVVMVILGCGYDGDDNGGDHGDTGGGGYDGDTGGWL
jgi:hypothetical protein